jgi:NYN domain
VARLLWRGEAGGHGPGDRVLPRCPPLRRPRRDRITLVAGDSGYEPAVTQLVADGFRVTVLYWFHASRELRQATTAFHVLDSYVAAAGLG